MERSLERAVKLSDPGGIIVDNRTWVFDQPYATTFVKARQAVLARLVSCLRDITPLQTALDVGCGVGYFSVMLREMKFQVGAIDGRDENIAEARRRVSQVQFHVRNIEDPTLADLGVFDLVLCFGLLYHLENPFRAIRNLYALTGRVALVESCCAPWSGSFMCLQDEGPLEDEALSRVAFYPTETCLVKMFYRARFPFVYRFRELPDHEDFRATLWRKQKRTMLAASRIALNISSLELISEPPSNPDLWATRLQVLRRAASRVRRLTWSDSTKSR